MVDASSKNRLSEMKVVYQTLDLLKVDNKKVITLFNKIDKLENPDDRLGLIDKRAIETVLISAKKGISLDKVGEAMENVLREDRKLLETVLPYSAMSLISEIKERGEILEEEYTEEGVRIKAYVTEKIYGRVSNG